MKKTLTLTLVAIIATLLFTGCAKNSDIALGKLHQKDGKEVSIKIVASSEDEFYVASYGKGALTMAEVMYLAATKVKEKGFNYFAITNSGANNLNGFPINTIKSLYTYVTLRTNNPLYATNGGNAGIGEKPLRQKTIGRLQVKVAVLGDEFKNSYISVWDVNKTIAEAIAAVDGNISVKF